jgi:sugar phosphate permease
MSFLRKLKIAGVCLLGQLFGSNMLLIGPLPMLMGHMEKEFGWNEYQFSFAASAVMLAGALAAPFLGRLIDRRGVRRVNLPGTIAVGLISLMLGRQTASIGLFYLLYALVGIFGAYGAGYYKIMGSLFTQHRGKALSVVQACSQVISAIFPIISVRLVLKYTWRGVFNVYGIGILITAILLYFLLEEPAGNPAPSPQRSEAGKDEPRPAYAPPVMAGLTTAEALRSRALWILIGSGVIAGIFGAGWSQHSWKFQIDRGFTDTMTANAMSVSLLIGWVGTLFGGWLLDRVQSAKVYILPTLMVALSVYLQTILWPNHGGMPLFIVAFTLSSMAVNIQMPMINYLYTRFFGMKSYGTIAGINMAVISLLSGISMPLIGYLHRRTGSYDVAMICIIVGYMLSVMLFLAIGRYRYTTDFKLMAEPEK